MQSDADRFVVRGREKGETRERRDRESQSDTDRFAVRHTERKRDLFALLCVLDCAFNKLYAGNGEPSTQSVGLRSDQLGAAKKTSLCGCLVC